MSSWEPCGNHLGCSWVTFRSLRCPEGFLQAEISTSDLKLRFFVLSLEPGVTRMDMDGLACERRVSRVESELMGGVSVGQVWDGRRE